MHLPQNLEFLRGKIFKTILRAVRTASTMDYYATVHQNGSISEKSLAQNKQLIVDTSKETVDPQPPSTSAFSVASLVASTDTASMPLKRYSESDTPLVSTSSATLQSPPQTHMSRSVSVSSDAPSNNGASLPSLARSNVPPAVPRRGSSVDLTRPYPCPWDDCHKTFTRKSDLSRHVQIHRNERPHQCSQCGKAFIQRSALTVHFRTHTGEKPFKCPFQNCGKAFSDSSSLARHRRTHELVRPFVCPFHYCKRTFSRRIALSRHIQSQHCGEVIPSSSMASQALVRTPAGSASSSTFGELSSSMSIASGVSSSGDVTTLDGGSSYLRESRNSETCIGRGFPEKATSLQSLPPVSSVGPINCSSGPSFRSLTDVRALPVYTSAASAAPLSRPEYPQYYVVPQLGHHYQPPSMYPKAAGYRVEGNQVPCQPTLPAPSLNTPMVPYYPPQVGPPVGESGLMVPRCGSQYTGEQAPRSLHSPPQIMPQCVGKDYTPQHSVHRSPAGSTGIPMGQHLQQQPLMYSNQERQLNPAIPHGSYGGSPQGPYVVSQAFVPGPAYSAPHTQGQGAPTQMYGYPAPVSQYGGPPPQTFPFGYTGQNVSLTPIPPQHLVSQQTLSDHGAQMKGAYMPYSGCLNAQPQLPGEGAHHHSQQQRQQQLQVAFHSINSDKSCQKPIAPVSGNPLTNLTTVNQPK